MSSRRKAREMALCALYAHELSRNPVSYVISELFTDGNCDDIREFCTRLVENTVKNSKTFDEMIRKKALNWEFNRIAVIDRIILRMAMCEFLYFDDIPPKVSIDEAIEIAKAYSTEKSGKFINGILDSVLSEWRSNKKFIKSGRGLVNGDAHKKSEPFNPSISKSELA